MPIMIFGDGAMVGKSWARRVGQRTKKRVTPKKGHRFNFETAARGRSRRPFRKSKVKGAKIC